MTAVDEKRVPSMPVGVVSTSRPGEWLASVLGCAILCCSVGGLRAVMGYGVPAGRLGGVVAASSVSWTLDKAHRVHPGYAVLAEGATRPGDARDCALVVSYGLRATWWKRGVPQFAGGEAQHVEGIMSESGVSGKGAGEGTG